MSKKSVESAENVSNEEIIVAENQADGAAEVIEITETEIADSPKQSKKFNKVKPPLSAEEQLKKKRKKRIIVIVIIILLLAAAAGGGIAAYFLIFNKPQEQTAEKTPEKTPEAPKYYSKLSGLEIASESENSLPTFCVQIPNGADGARPQTGLSEAPVVFEAIAEAGITRFAAVFQNPKSKAIGPIRSLRTYYLDWDTPFDCTVVHAGGSNEAIAALKAGGYRDLTESTTYMWRDYSSYWAPNNLMTSPDLLTKFNTDNGYTSSTPKTFPRYTPDEAKNLAATAYKNAGLDGENSDSQNSNSQNSNSQNSDSQNENENSEQSPIIPLISQINVNFGYVSTFNTIYKYDVDTNTYPRSYANGEEHLVYSCADTDKVEPSPKQDCGIAKQIAPSAIAVMMVDERLDSDNYHHVIQTIGTGIAYIFQNGGATKGTWKKSSASAQIEFTDEAGNTISFTPGQLWIAAVPNYGGSVEY